MSSSINSLFISYCYSFLGWSVDSLYKFIFARSALYVGERIRTDSLLSVVVVVVVCPRFLSVLPLVEVVASRYCLLVF